MHLNLFTTIHLSDSNNYYHTKLILLGKDHKLVYKHSLLLCGMQSKKKEEGGNDLLDHYRSMLKQSTFMFLFLVLCI